MASTSKKSRSHRKPGRKARGSYNPQARDVISDEGFFRHGKPVAQPLPKASYAQNLACRYTAYCDGCCFDNGKKGISGWGFLVCETGDEFFDGETPSTNNRAELMAILDALEHFRAHYPGSVVRIVSDSQYAIRGCSQWLKKWKSNGWNKSKVKNIDLWKRLDEIIVSFEGRAIFDWVKGHNGNRWNEMSDRLASDGARSQKRVLRMGGKTQAFTIAADAPLDDGLPGGDSQDFIWGA